MQRNSNKKPWYSCLDCLFADDQKSKEHLAKYKRMNEQPNEEKTQLTVKRRISDIWHGNNNNRNAAMNAKSKQSREKLAEKYGRRPFS